MIELNYRRKNMTDNQSPIETADQSDAAADLQVQDLPVEETEQDHIKGGTSATWYLRNSNSSGAA
jgi:hypothetical protein